ncbi:MAG: DUF484 family protein [Methylococcales bacterium]|nr:DUF484 family protein [Methylococcales bacterium]
MSNVKPLKDNIDPYHLSSQQVENYLQKHPEFFHDHLDLLESMFIPHPSGSAVSLISKQLEIFRSKHHYQEDQLIDLIEIAKENDTSSNRMHELALALIEAKTIKELVSNLDKVFADCFLTDFTAIRIIKDNVPPPVSKVFVKSNNKKLIHFEKELTTNKSTCGYPTLAQAKFLFGSNVAPEVKSCAIIPMSFTKLDGLIAIGSRDEKRFHYNMGNLFLTQMSEVIGTRLISLLSN